MRAFEAAARLESFVAAADELRVTPGAISQHIKTLEGWAGCPLFERKAHGVALSQTGRTLLPSFVAAFDALGSATHALRQKRPMAEIHIAAIPSVAQLWLPSRLGRLRRKHPHIKISVTAMEMPPNLGRELFDVALFFQSDPVGMGQVALEDDLIFPICAPDLANMARTSDGLNALPLLQDQTWYDDWTIWSNGAGVDLGAPTAGPQYSLYSLAVEEAKSGAGVLMGHASLVRPALEEGTLVAVSDRQVESGRKLVLSQTELALRSPDLLRVIAGLAGKGTLPEA